MEHAKQAYILLIDGIPLAFTTDTSGELSGSGASSFIGRAEADTGETVGGREIREGLEVPGTLEFGNLEDSMGLGRTTARFSVLIDSDEKLYLNGQPIGESNLEMKIEELLGNSPPGDRTVLLKVHRDATALRFEPVIESISNAGGELVHIVEEDRDG